MSICVKFELYNKSIIITYENRFWVATSAFISKDIELHSYITISLFDLKCHTKYIWSDFYFYLFNCISVTYICFLLEYTLSIIENYQILQYSKLQWAVLGAILRICKWFTWIKCKWIFISYWSDIAIYFLKMTIRKI